LKLALLYTRTNNPHTHDYYCFPSHLHLIKGLLYKETTKFSPIGKENDRPEGFLLSAYGHIILNPPVATLCLRSYYPPASCCYSMPTAILSSSLLLLINKTIANTVYTQLLLLSAYRHTILQPPVAHKQNNSKYSLYTTVATLCLLSYYPLASCCS